MTNSSTQSCPCYGNPNAYTEVRRSAIALNGAFFNAQRMVLQYVRNAYLGVEP